MLPNLAARDDCTATHCGLPEDQYTIQVHYHKEQVLKHLNSALSKAVLGREVRDHAWSVHKGQVLKHMKSVLLTTVLGRGG